MDSADVDVSATSAGLLTFLQRVWGAGASGGSQGSLSVRYDSPCELLEKGNEVAVFRFSLAYDGVRPSPLLNLPPAGHQLVARIFFVRPHRKLALFEKCLHNGLRDKGFFTPRVWVAEDESPELGSVVVMDLVAARIQKGAALFGMVRSLRLMLCEMPDVCAATVASLHATPIDSVLSHFDQAGVRVQDVNFRAWLQAYKPRVDAVVESEVCPKYGELYNWLVKFYQPVWDDPSTAVVCHGDLFPPNILMSSGPATLVSGVIDWSCAVVTTPAFDVGVGQGGFEGAHVSAPQCLLGFVRGLKRRISARYARAYTRHMEAVPRRSRKWKYNAIESRYFQVARFLFAMTPLLEKRIPGRPPHRYILHLAPQKENEYMEEMRTCIRAITRVDVEVPPLAVPAAVARGVARLNCACQSARFVVVALALGFGVAMFLWGLSAITRA